MSQKGQPENKRMTGDLNEPCGFAALTETFPGWMRVKNYSERTIENRQTYCGLNRSMTKTGRGFFLACRD